MLLYEFLWVFIFFNVTVNILHCGEFFSLFNNPLGFLQDHFVLVVSEFMYIPWKHAQKLAASRASLQEGSSCTPSITVAAAENFESHIVQYVKGEV